MVPGARIELATPAFSGRRSTTELPRHKWFRNCMGWSAIVSIHLRSMGTFTERLRSVASPLNWNLAHQSEEKSRKAAVSLHF
jgi:hypothetical protein